MSTKALLTAGLLLWSLPATAADTLAPHRALYALSLAKSDASSGPNAVRGQLYYAQDDSCEAWTSDRRFAVAYSYPDGGDNDGEQSRYTSYESKDGKHFNFSGEHRQAGEDQPSVWRGTVMPRKGGAARAAYSIPDDLSFDLPRGYYLPAAFTQALIAKARAGETSLSGTVFDGTDINGPVLMSAFIGKAVTAEERAALAKGAQIDAGLLAPEAWHVRLALFPVTEDDDITPFYEVQMVLHANGVVSHALDIYKGFTLEETLTALEKLPRRSCD